MDEEGARALARLTVYLFVAGLQPNGDVEELRMRLNKDELHGLTAAELSESSTSTLASSPRVQEKDGQSDVLSEIANENS